MPQNALITEFDSHGAEKRQISTTFRIVGKDDNLAVEIQVGTNKTVEVNVQAVKAAELKYRLAKGKR